jgi:hypothetical protein
MFSQKFIGWNVELDEQKKFFDIMGTLIIGSVTSSDPHSLNWKLLCTVYVSSSIGDLLICSHALVYKTFHSLKSLSDNNGLCVLINT